MKTGQLHFILAEFGTKRQNAGDSTLPAARLEPTLSSVQPYASRITLYTDGEVSVDGDVPVDVITVDPPFNPDHPRYGNHCNDYYKVFGLLESDHDVAIALDSDMQVVSDEVLTLGPLTERFGMCVPANPRGLVQLDGICGIDGDYALDEDPTRGNGFAYNMSPIAFHTRNDRFRAMLDTYCRIMSDAPVRGPLAMWRAAWQTATHPYILPSQWCVSQGQVGLPHPIVLHLGHGEVDAYYHGGACRRLATVFGQHWRALRRDLKRLRSRDD